MQYEPGFDFRITPDGDLVKETDGDLMITNSYLNREQQVRMRLLLSHGDWASDLRYGADLDELRGRPNTQELGEEVVGRVLGALTHDGLFLEQDLSVDAVPLSREEIVVSIETVGVSGPPQTFRMKLHTVNGPKPLF